MCDVRACVRPLLEVTVNFLFFCRWCTGADSPPPSSILSASKTNNNNNNHQTNDAHNNNNNNNNSNYNYNNSNESRSKKPVLLEGYSKSIAHALSSLGERAQIFNLFSVMEWWPQFTKAPFAPPTENTIMHLAATTASLLRLNYLPPLNIPLTIYNTLIDLNLPSMYGAQHASFASCETKRLLLFFYDSPPFLFPFCCLIQ